MTGRTLVAACMSVAFAVAACGEHRALPEQAVTSDSAVASAPDSLALTLSDGATVWYTMQRDARAADGTQCVERTLEIRRDGNRIAVPLLYTRDVPVELNDTTLEARVYLGCTPGDRYRIDSRTGLPTPVR